MKKHLIHRLLPILALGSLFIKISGAVPPPPLLSGPGLAFLGSRVVFRCSAPDLPPPVTYELLSEEGVRFSTYTDVEGGGRPASLHLRVSGGSDGRYHCRASAGGTSRVSNDLQLSVVTPASQTAVTSEPSPPVVFQGSRLVLSCEVQRGSHLSYTWFFNRREVRAFASRLFHPAGNQLLMERVTPEHEGNYSCIAWSSVQDIRRFSSSSEVQVTVRVYVSKPQISFSVLKEASGYRGNVSCWSSEGSPPVNVSLWVEDLEVGSVRLLDSLSAWFLVDLVPGLDMGVARCRVTSEAQELLSEPVTLEVVPVGGEVKVEVEYLYTTESRPAAALLSCLISRGTFPHVSWTFNGSALPTGSREDRPVLPPHHHHHHHRSAFLLTRLGQEESGSYRCRVRDSYDPSGPWLESQDQLVQVTEVEFSTTELITVSFCCFLLLMLAVCAACVFKMLDQQPAHTQISLPHSEGFSLLELTSQSGGKPALSPHRGCSEPAAPVKET